MPKLTRCLIVFLLVFCWKHSMVCSKKTKIKTIWSKLNLPNEHMPFFFSSNNKLRKRCLADDDCPFKEHAAKNATKCWGYEANCGPKKRLFLTECPEDSRGWVFKLFFPNHIDIIV